MEAKTHAPAHKPATALLMLCGCLLLAACNTNEVLIPKVGIGESQQSFRSPPVTQQEVDDLAGVPRAQAFAEEEPSPSYRVASGTGAFAATEDMFSPGIGAPPTTMQAQADALAQNNTTVSPASSVTDGSETRPLRDDDFAQSSMSDASENELEPQVASLPPASSDRSGKSTVHFLPLVGAPVQAVTPLSRQLGAEARAKGLFIKSANDPDSDYIFKGYLSASSDEGAVTVTYMWDILDNKGTRLHRIQGEEKVPSASTDPWAGVPASIMQNIASKTMTEFSSWRQTRRS